MLSVVEQQASASLRQRMGQDYFDDGPEWWGVWCLSIWNPKRGTLAVLAASTTD
ncbi:hypothetical protein [Pseudomonas fluorescens]|uniref:hypothetical protein n=1 Tax=Pseudomonas fluorescens TaxID=294 RepID=UPI0014310614|nr:hypothetical protein [Pseudomonas fluorescens]